MPETAKENFPTHPWGLLGFSSSSLSSPQLVHLYQPNPMPSMLKILLASSFGDDEPRRGMLNPPAASSRTRLCHLIFTALQISQLSDPHASPLHNLHIPAHARAGSLVGWRDHRMAVPNGRALHHHFQGFRDHPGNCIHLLPLLPLLTLCDAEGLLLLLFDLPDGYLLLGCWMGDLALLGLRFLNRLKK